MGRLRFWYLVQPLERPVLLVVLWGLLVLGAVTVERWTRSAFVQDMAANFVADSLVAGLAFILANWAFGFIQGRRQRIEAQEKAFLLLAMEMRDNETELERIRQALAEGGRATSNLLRFRQPALCSENWKLIIQSPLAAQLPVDLVLTLQKSYYGSERLAKELVDSQLGVFARSMEGWDALADEFLPQFEQALESTGQAIRLLELGVGR